MTSINATIFSAFGLGVAMLGPITPSIGAPAATGQTQPAESGKQLKLTATVNPASPRVGDNDLNLMVVDADGKPVSGLKLSARVEMTSMDMGTAKPAVKDIGDGRYRSTVTFGMAGPWRVTVRANGGKAVLDFDAGGKSAWKSPTVTLTSASKSASPSAAAGTSMPGMIMSAPMTDATDASKTAPATQNAPMANMSGMSMGASSSSETVGPLAPLRFPGYGPYGKPSEQSSDMAGMNMAGKDKMQGMSVSASDDKPVSPMSDMSPMTMPRLKEDSAYVASGQENWKQRIGFGQNAGMVGMMSQMMVGGSGMEGMKMAPMAMKFDEQNFTEDASEGPNGSSATAPHDASMPGMNMDNGAMPGMKMGGGAGGPQKPTDAAPTQPATAASKSADAPTTPETNTKPTPAPAGARTTPATLKIAGSIANPKYGDNTLTITIKDAAGAPVTGAQLTTSVEMTSMNMGVTHPQSKEIGNGQYRVTAAFSMSGPWRVTVKATPPGGGPAQKAAFDFNAKSRR